MEPIASAFATIVSLIGQFRAESESSKNQEFSDFIEWLTKTQHEEIVKLLHINTKASVGIKALLQQDREIFLERLESIDNALSHFASAIDGFSDIAEGINPRSLLSKQALSILRQFDASGSSKVLGLKSNGGPIYLFLSSTSGSNQLEFDDTRFIEDDFRTLVSLGLLHQDFNSKGEPVYIFTRLASELIQSVD